MGGEHRTILEARETLGQTLTVESERIDPFERIEELSGTFGLQPQLLDPMHLFGDIRQVKVDRKRPHEKNRLNVRNAVDDARKIFTGVGVSTPETVRVSSS